MSPINDFKYMHDLKGPYIAKLRSIHFKIRQYGWRIEPVRDGEVALIWNCLFAKEGCPAPELKRYRCNSHEHVLKAALSILVSSLESDPTCRNARITNYLYVRQGEDNAFVWENYYSEDSGVNIPKDLNTYTFIHSGGPNGKDIKHTVVAPTQFHAECAVELNRIELNKDYPSTLVIGNYTVTSVPYHEDIPPEEVLRKMAEEQSKVKAVLPKDSVILTDEHGEIVAEVALNQLSEDTLAIALVRDAILTAIEGPLDEKYILDLPDGEYNVSPGLRTLLAYSSYGNMEKYSSATLMDMFYNGTASVERFTSDEGFVPGIGAIHLKSDEYIRMVPPSPDIDSDKLRLKKKKYYSEFKLKARAGYIASDLQYQTDMEKILINPNNE